MRLVIRADAGPRIGAGHVVRSTALAQAWVRAGGEVLLVTACEFPPLLRAAAAAGCTVQQVTAGLDAAEFLAIAAGADRVALDGYGFDAGYQRRLVEGGHRLLVIDDYNHLPRYHAEWILNQNYGAERCAYAAGPHTRLLLGTRYALLRPEIVAGARAGRVFPETARTVLVTLGGGEQAEAAVRVLEALALVATPLRVRFAVGSGGAAAALIRERATAVGQEIEVLEGVNDLAPHMAWADFAVSGGGSTAWELAYLGVPALLVSIADNQDGIVAALGRDRLALAAGRLADLKAERLAELCSRLARRRPERERLSRAGRALVDGGGARRVVESLGGA